MDILVWRRESAGNRPQKLPTIILDRFGDGLMNSSIAPTSVATQITIFRVKNVVSK